MVITIFTCCFRWFKHAGESYIKVPFFGAVSYLTLAVSPFCIVFAVVWAVYRRISFAWIGQDILVSAWYASTLVVIGVIMSCIDSGTWLWTNFTNHMLKSSMLSNCTHRCCSLTIIWYYRQKPIWWNIWKLETSN